MSQKRDDDRPLPSSLDAERSILGAILLDNQAIVTAAKAGINAYDFFLPQNTAIYQAMATLAENNSAIDLVILPETLRQAGTLQQCGGEPYIASLADGMPRVSNVEHYVRIVKECAIRRRVIHACHNVQQRAWEGEESPDALTAFAQNSFVGLNGNGNGHNPLVAVDVLDFLEMKLDPIDFVIMPILPVSNSAMIFAPTGVGKTYIMLYMAYSVAIGAPNIFVWEIPKRRPVVYIDGEMDQLTLQERQTEIAKSFLPVMPERGYMKIITPDQQPKFPPRINTKEGRARIEEHLQPGGFGILDNIVTLCPGGDEKESEDWSVIQEWILYLRRNRISLFMVQHAGKSGDQIGTSKKEIQLSCNIKLRTQSDYTAEDGLRVEAQVKKLRRRGKDGEWNPRWAQPFEISYRTVEGIAEFSTRPMRAILRTKAIQMLQAGMRENDVAQETGLDRFQIYRLKKKIQQDGIAAAESTAE